MVLVDSCSWQTIATSILPPPMVKWSYLHDLSAPKKSPLGRFTSAGVMQCLLLWLRCSAIDCFILSRYCAGTPGMFISWIVTFDSHSPGSTIWPPFITPDCFTAAATWLPVAFLRLTSGPLLQALRQRTVAATHASCFM